MSLQQEMRPQKAHNFPARSFFWFRNHLGGFKKMDPWENVVKLATGSFQ